MEPRPDFFPVYVSGQYLTSEHLNETHNFLWQQEKATRYILAGNGIVNGLDADLTGSPLMQTITVSAGSAATIDGYIIREDKNLVFNKALVTDLSWYTLAGNVQQLMEKTEYEKVKGSLGALSEVVLKAVEIIPNTVAADDLPDGWKNLNDASLGITSAQALSSYVILAWVFITDAENNHCQQGDCNTKGVQRNFSTRYFLISKSDLPVLNSVSEELDTCSVNRIKKLSDCGSVSGFNNKSFDTWTSDLGEIGPYFIDDTAGKKLSNITALFGTSEQNLYASTKTRWQQISTTVTAAGCAQYYNLFAADVAKAINELVLFYNDYAKKYPSFGTHRIERTIIIGSFRQTAIDQWRYYFIPATGQVQYQFDKKRLRVLLLRLFALVNNFTEQSKIQALASAVTTKPQLLPSIAAGEVLLQNCAIPYYYNVLDKGIDNDVFKYWNPQGGKLKNVHCYYDSKVPGREYEALKVPSADWYYYNFFRLEGHLGMNKDTAISAVRKLISTQGLPLQVIDCDVNYKGPQNWIIWYEGFVNNVNKWVVNLRKDYPDIGEYTFAPIKKIQEGITQTSYRDVQGVMKVLKDFNAYSGVMYNAPKQQGLKEKSGTSKGVPASAYEHYAQKIPKKEVEQMNVQVKEILAEQGTTAAPRLILLSDLIDMEYMGGALRGGTLVLLHDGAKIIGDGCLSYFYKVSDARIYSAATV